MSRNERFPGFDVLAQAGHWDEATRAEILDRMHGLPAMRFFTPQQEATLVPLLDQLMGQRTEPGEPRVDLARMVDARLAERQTDGWHLDSMPIDLESWPLSLKALNEDAVTAFGSTFGELAWDQQHEVLERLHSSQDEHWHGMPRSAVWGLWTRYAATAFYSHPDLWSEIGFSGPSYPRGYKNLGVDKREPFEVRDAHPRDDPARGTGR
jgi:gluconate 2-dehydrogenase subunit 3-like protein